MTAVGYKLPDATGRSSGRRKTNRRTRIEGQFAPRPIEMLESPAYRVLGLTEHRILARLEIELAHHGGTDNGRLVCTYVDFVGYGARENSIPAALHNLEALGFIEITERGRGGNADFGKPHRFRLTYLPACDAAPTDEWRRLETIAAARTALIRKSKTTPRNAGETAPRNAGEITKSPPPETLVHTSPAKRGVLSISRVQGGGERVGIDSAVLFRHPPTMSALDLSSLPERTVLAIANERGLPLALLDRAGIRTTLDVPVLDDGAGIREAAA